MSIWSMRSGSSSIVRQGSYRTVPEWVACRQMGSSTPLTLQLHGNAYVERQKLSNHERQISLLKVKTTEQRAWNRELAKKHKSWRKTHIQNLQITSDIVACENRRGHPSSAVFSLFSYTSYTCADSFCLAHLQWLCHFCATIDNFCLASLQWLNKTKENKKQKKWQDPTLCHYSPHWGVQSCLFVVFFVFYFFDFLVFGFLVFWFVVGCLKGWQNNTKVKDLDLTLCQFSHFRGCKRAFGWFYCLRWACGSIRKPCKKPWQNAGITGGSLGGLGRRLGNFVCLCNCSKSVFDKCKNIGSQWMCRTDFDIDIVGSNPWVNTC